MIAINLLLTLTATQVTDVWETNMGTVLDLWLYKNELDRDTQTSEGRW